MYRQNLYLSFCLLFLVSFQPQGQIVNLPSLPQPANLGRYGNINQGSSLPLPSQNNRQQLEMYERDKREVEAREAAEKQLYKEMTVKNAVSYELPSYSDVASTSHYRTAFKRLLTMENKSYSIAEANFVVENAFYENVSSFLYGNSNLK